METKYVRVPFEVELAKRIQNKECEGRIVVRHGESVRIVCWDAKREDNLIALILNNDSNTERAYDYTSNGRVFIADESPLDLILEIPEYMTFKDGDILTSCGCPFIFKGYKDDGCMFYAGVNATNNLVISNESLLWTYDSSDCTFSTEEEKQKLIDALKASKDPRAKECLKILGIESKPECEFKTGQPVIGIAGNGEWRYDLFSHYKPEYRNGNYVCSARSYSKCLPYNEQTAHLVGTKEIWEE